MGINWALIRAAIVVLALSLGAWRIHQQSYLAGTRDCEAAHAALADAAADRARQEAAAQSQRERTAQRADAAARFDQLTRRHALDTDIARHPAPADCGLDTAALGLLNDAVRAANTGADATPSDVPGGVPAGAGADRSTP